ncbi:MAG: NAD(P)H-hydrate dehydratase [Lachnospiraceae bacterium]|nr:NAD(P)H-hydrate dehydratase [Lachnospiraceae bacterium]
MRKSDAYTIEHFTSGRELMMRAAKGVLEASSWRGPVAIVCGSGNNAGDGYALALLLYEKKIRSDLFLLSEKFSEDGRYYFDKCIELGIKAYLCYDGKVVCTENNCNVENVHDAENNCNLINIPDTANNMASRVFVAEYSKKNESDLSGENILKEHITSDGSCSAELDFSEYSEIVDCIFGTGFKGEARGIAGSVIRKINATKCNVINDNATRGNITKSNSTNSVDTDKEKALVKVISVDINSGLNGDSGMAALDKESKEPICVKSDLTVSIGSFKPGHFLGMAKDVIASKVNTDIGIEPVDLPYHMLGDEDFKGCLKPRKQLSNKGTYGYIALIGGSLRYSGAIRLAYMANAAMRAGAGVVKVAVPASISKYMISEILESTLFPLKDAEGEIKFNPDDKADCEMVDELVRNVKTVAFGMGIGATEDTKVMLQYILENYKGRLIIDADGLTVFSQILSESESSLGQSSVCDNIPSVKPLYTRDDQADIIAEDRHKTKVACEIILTPHIKEFSRLSGKSIEEINQNPISEAKGLALKLSEMLYAKASSEEKPKVVVLLKGPTTIITDGNEVNLIDKGCAGMATAGSGDVLSGIMSATAAWEGNMLKAATMAAYINGLAGEMAEKETNAYSMTAGDTAKKVAFVMNAMVGKCEDGNVN